MSGRGAASRPPERLPRRLPARERREALPAQRPRRAAEERAAPDAVQMILQSPSYREADRDVDFLNRNETRGPRLELDYLKAETLLERHEVAHTIVVFGGTRIPDPRLAREAVEAARAALAADPESEAGRRRLRIARRRLANSRYYEIARQFGRLVGAAGPKALGGRIMVMTGGGPGIMEAANRGAHDVGAKSIGLNITLPREQYPNPYITPDLCFRFHYFAVRKLHFLLRARALIAFPGGFGTFDELFEVLTLAQARKMEPVPVILVGESYWRGAFNPDHLVEEGVIDPEDRELFWYAETAQDIWQDILLWYELKGIPLLPKEGGGPAGEGGGPAR